MDSFKAKYVAFTALLLLIADIAKGMAVQGETLIQKIEGEAAALPDLMGFLPKAGSLGAELDMLKSSPDDMVVGAELLVTDLAFSSDKAKAIVAAAFPLAEKTVGMIGDVKALVTAIQG